MFLVLRLEPRNRRGDYREQAAMPFWSRRPARRRTAHGTFFSGAALCSSAPQGHRLQRASRAATFSQARGAQGDDRGGQVSVRGASLIKCNARPSRPAPRSENRSVAHLPSRSRVYLTSLALSLAVSSPEQPLAPQLQLHLFMRNDVTRFLVRRTATHCLQDVEVVLHLVKSTVLRQSIQQRAHLVFCRQCTCALPLTGTSI